MSNLLSGQEAQLRYRDHDFDVIRPGDYVLCAVTGRRIAIEQLRYWNVERQEAYVDAGAALQKWQETRNG